MNRLLIAAIMLLVAVYPAMADVYDQAMMEVAVNNAEIKALEAEDRSRVGLLRSENNLQDPEVEFEHVWGTHGIGTKWGISVSQTFDYPGLYKLRGKIARESETAYSFMRKNVVLDKMLDVKTTLIDLVYNRRMEIMLTAMRDNMKELRDNCKVAYESGEGTILDVNKAEIELAKMERRLSQCRQDIVSLGAVLEAEGISTGTIEDAESYPLERIKSEEEYMSELERNPLLAYYASMSHVESLNGKAVSMSNIPSISVGYRHDYELGESFNGFTVGLSLPLFSNRHKKLASQSAVAAAEFQRQAIRIAAETSVRADYENARELRDVTMRLAPVFEQTDHALLLMKAWRGGEINVLTYIQETVYFTEAHMEYLGAERDYQAALARLNRFQPLLKRIID